MTSFQANKNTSKKSENSKRATKLGRSCRGRPRDDSKNQAILNAAIDLFLENGYEATSMDAVAKEAGVSKQTVYSHFENKESLFSAAVREKINDHRPEQALAQVTLHSLEADMQAVCETYARLLVSPEAIGMFRLLVSNAAKKDGIAGQALSVRFWEAGPAVIMDELKAFLDGLCKAGALKIANLDQAAIQLIALLKGGGHFEMAIGLLERVDEDFLKAHVAGAVDMFLCRYRARP